MREAGVLIKGLKLARPVKGTNHSTRNILRQLLKKKKVRRARCAYVSNTGKFLRVRSTMAFSLKAQRQNKVGLSWGSFWPPQNMVSSQDTGEKAALNDRSRPVQHSSSTKKQRQNKPPSLQVCAHFLSVTAEHPSTMSS